MTVRENDVVCVADEPVPVIVIVYVPGAVELEVEIVSVDDAPVVTEDGENDAVAPDGRPLALSETVCAEPEVAAVETVAVVPDPAVTDADDGLTEIEKSFVRRRPGPERGDAVRRAEPGRAVVADLRRCRGTPASTCRCWPVVTSQSALVLAYGYEFGIGARRPAELASAYIAPMIGDETLVPPNTVQPPEPYES